MNCSASWGSLRRRVLGAVCSAACLLALAACGAPLPGASPDVLSQKSGDPARTPVTVLVKYAFSIHNFEAAVEEKFPNIDLIQVGNYTRDMGTAEYARRLEHDDLTDIIMTWPLDVGEAYWEDRLLDLSGLDLTGRYNLSMLGSIARDGKLYYLPGPSQVRGIVYNKTLFAEHGWQVPDSFEGFVALCKTIEASGIRALQLGFENPEVLDTAFVGFNYADCFRSPGDAQWRSDYNAGAGRFEEQFGPALALFQRMIDEGIWQPGDLEVNYADRETLFFTRQCAMIEDSVLVARMGGMRTGTTDEFALMPFLNPGDDGDWARLYMVCYIGLNRHLAEAEHKEKYELVLQLLDYISTPEGQLALASDTGAMFSSLSEAPPPEVPEIVALGPALSAGRAAVFPTLKNAQSALREGLAGMVRGDLTGDQVAAMVDAQNRTPPTPAPPQVLAQAERDFTLSETGAFLSDALREASGCELALFLDNGKDGRYNNLGVSGRIYKGDVTDVDLSCILPDWKSEHMDVLCTAAITGKDLRTVLEYAVPVDNNQTGWFYYCSGLRMTMDPTAAPGGRIQSLTLADGSALQDDRIYTVAFPKGSVPEGLVSDYQERGQSITQTVTQALQAAGRIAPSGDGRFTLP